MGKQQAFTTLAGNKLVHETSQSHQGLRYTLHLGLLAYLERNFPKNWQITCGNLPSAFPIEIVVVFIPGFVYIPTLNYSVQEMGRNQPTVVPFGCVSKLASECVFSFHLEITAFDPYSPYLIHHSCRCGDMTSLDLHPGIPIIRSVFSVRYQSHYDVLPPVTFDT
jgi:hypothetical protein